MQSKSRQKLAVVQRV